jgi:hypothetical protein
MTLSNRKANFLIVLLIANGVLSFVMVIVSLMTQIMLKGRAVMSITNLSANWKNFDENERAEVKNNWHRAEYDKILSYDEFLERQKEKGK